MKAGIKSNHLVMIKCSVEPEHSTFIAIQVNKWTEAAVFALSLLLGLLPAYTGQTEGLSVFL